MPPDWEKDKSDPEHVALLTQETVQVGEYCIQLHLVHLLIDKRALIGSSKEQQSIVLRLRH